MSQDMSQLKRRQGRRLLPQLLAQAPGETVKMHHALLTARPGRARRQAVCTTSWFDIYRLVGLKIILR
jgi:hypothetical protein